MQVSEHLKGGAYAGVFAIGFGLLYFCAKAVVQSKFLILLTLSLHTLFFLCFVSSILGLGLLAETLCKDALKLAAYCMAIVTIAFWFVSDISWFATIFRSGSSDIQNALIGLVTIIYISLGSIIGSL